MTANEGQAQFTIEMPISIRQMQRDDLPKIEWRGQFIHYRNLFRRSFKEQMRGNRHLLIATCNDYPIARLFVQFRNRNASIADGRTRGYLYSFYVMEVFRGRGIGTRLIVQAEQILQARGFQAARIAVAKENTGARRLYERQGYSVFAEDPGRWRYTDHKGKMREVYEPCWMMEKTLHSVG